MRAGPSSGEGWGQGQVRTGSRSDKGWVKVRKGLGSRSGEGWGQGQVRVGVRVR